MNQIIHSPAPSSQPAAPTQFQAYTFDAIGITVRAFKRPDGSAWFVAKDVCDALGYGNPRQALATHLDDDEKGVTNLDTLGGRQSVSVITESGLYALVLRSNKPQARPFRQWVGTTPDAFIKEQDELAKWVQAPPIARGRPAVTFDNTRVRAFLAPFPVLRDPDGVLPAALDMHPFLGDILTGVASLQTEGQNSTRPLSTKTLFRILSHCEQISVQDVADALSMGRPYGDVGQRHARRYASHARVAAKAIARVLDQRPWLESAATFLAPRGTKRQTLAEAQAAIDAPYFAELRAAGLM